jgi:iron complex outermembrane receptor protein
MTKRESEGLAKLIRTKRLMLAGSASVLIALSQGPSALAQDQDVGGSDQDVGVSDRVEDSEVVLGQVMVTARRRDEALSRVPASVSVLGERDLEALSIKSESDLQRAVPGLTIRESLSSNQLNYSLRGQSVEAFSSSSPGVLSYVNEFQASGTSASSLYDLSSIQVVRGPQGTLFGRNTTGGAVLYTTARPENEFGGSIVARAGDYNLRGLEAAVNIPIVDDKVLLRLAGSFTDRDGYQFNDFRNEDLGSVESRSGRASLLLNLSDNIENITVLQYDTSGGTNVGSPIYNLYACAPQYPVPCTYEPTGLGPGWAPYVAANPGAFPDGIAAFTALQQSRGPYRVSLNSFMDHEGEQTTFVNTTTIDLSPTLTLKNIAGWADGFSSDTTDVDGTPYGVYTNGPIEDLDHTVYDSRQYSDELQLQGSAFSSNLSYILGAYYGYQRIQFYIPTAFFDLRPIGGPPPIATKDNEQETTTTGVFVHGTLDLSSFTGVDGLSMSAGYRHTWEDVEARHLPRSVYFGLSPDGLNKSFDKPSWNLGLEYQATDNLLLYATTRGSWRSGGFNTNSQLFSGTIATGGAEFAPETTTDVELGLKYSGQLGGAPTSFNVALFDQTIDDIQRVIYVTLPVFGPTALTANIPEAQVKGVEIQAQIEPTDWLTTGFNIAYTDAEFTKNAATIFSVTNTFGPYPDTPEWSTSAFVQVGLPVPSNWGDMSFRADVYDQTEFFYSSQNDTINPGSELPGYTLVNLRLNWDKIAGSNVGASAFVSNVTDEVYYTGGLALGSVLGLNQAIPGRPRMAGVELRVPF